MASRELGIDEFVTHKTGGGGDLTYFSKWKDRDEGLYKGDKRLELDAAPAHSADVALHTKCGIVIVWRHQLPKVVTFDDKKTGRTETKVWSQNLVCWEPEQTLKKQYKYDDDGGRVLPPEKCGICLLSEHVRKLVNAGELAWTDVVFEFTGDDSRDDKRITAGHLYNAFKSNDLTDAELDDLKSHGVSKRDAWKFNVMPKGSYIFRLVDLDNEDEGVQIAIENVLLGDRMKEAIGKEIEREGKEAGNPLRTPYAFRWKHLPKEKEIQKQYVVNVVRKRPLTDAVRELILDGDAPDIDVLTSKFNAKTVRAQLEEHCKIDLPWDDFFGKAEAEEDEAADARPARAPDAKAARAPEVAAKKAAAAPADDDEETVKCDNCPALIKVSWPKCPKCGHVYDVEAAPEPEPEPEPEAPKPRTRAEAKAAAEAAKAAASKPAAKPATKPAPKQQAAKPAAKPAAARDAEPEFDPEDDIPF